MTSKDAWSCQDLVDHADNWSLAGNVGLLKHMEQFAENLFQQADETNNNLENLLHELDSTEIQLDLVKNQFVGLQNTQFIESRVYEDDETVGAGGEVVSEVADVKLDDARKKELLKSAVVDGLKVLDRYYERVSIPESDSEGDETDCSNYILREKDPYINRPLPYVIGTQEWHTKWHAGLAESSDDDEDDEERGENGKSLNVEDEFSDTDSETNLPVADRRSQTEDNSKPHDYPTNDNYYEVNGNSVSATTPIATPTFAEQLAAKLGDVLTTPGDPEVNTRPIQRQPTNVANPLIPEIPPELPSDDRTGLFSGGGGLFDDDDDEKPPPIIPATNAPKKVRNLFDEDEDEDDLLPTTSLPQKPAVNTQKKVGGLFDDEDEEKDNEDIFAQSSQFPPLKRKDNSGLVFLPTEPPSLEGKREKRKPIGGVNILGGFLPIRKDSLSFSEEDDRTIREDVKKREDMRSEFGDIQDKSLENVGKGKNIVGTVENIVGKDANSEENVGKVENAKESVENVQKLAKLANIEKLANVDKLDNYVAKLDKPLKNNEKQDRNQEFSHSTPSSPPKVEKTSTKPKVLSLFDDTDDLFEDDDDLFSPSNKPSLFDNTKNENGTPPKPPPFTDDIFDGNTTSTSFSSKIETTTNSFRKSLFDVDSESFEEPPPLFSPTVSSKQLQSDDAVKPKKKTRNLFDESSEEEDELFSNIVMPSKVKSNKIASQTQGRMGSDLFGDIADDFSQDFVEESEKEMKNESDTKVKVVTNDKLESKSLGKIGSDLFGVISDDFLQDFVEETKVEKVDEKEIQLRSDDIENKSDIKLKDEVNETNENKTEVNLEKQQINVENVEKGTNIVENTENENVKNVEKLAIVEKLANIEKLENIEKLANVESNANVSLLDGNRENENQKENNVVKNAEGEKREKMVKPTPSLNKPQPRASLSLFDDTPPPLVPEEEDEQKQGVLSQEGSPEKKLPGKLKLPALNINVSALMPGARLPKSQVAKEEDKDAENVTNSGEGISGTLEESGKVEVGIAKVGVVPESLRSLSEDEDTSLVSDVGVDILPSVTKSRAKIPIKRRPSTRQGRKAALQSSQKQETTQQNSHSPSLPAVTPPASLTTPDTRDTTTSRTNTQTDKPLTEEIPQKAENKKKPEVEDIKTSPPMIYTGNDSKIKQSEGEKPRILLPTTNDNDIDIFDDIKSSKTTNIALFDDDDEDIFASTSKSTKAQQPEALSTPKKLIIEDDTDIFTEKPKPVASQPKTSKKTLSLFGDDDDDDDLFAVAKPVKTNKQMPKGVRTKHVSLFGDDDGDDDDDIFNVKRKDTNRISKNMPKVGKVSTNTTSAAKVKSDPLADLFGDSD